MSSPFSSALAKLDDSLQTIQSRMESLGAALEVNEDQLSSVMADARLHAATLRDLIHGERPDARWTDRGDLERLVKELEIAAHAKLNQERRAKLLDLANELDAGTIKHRFQARCTELNSLRLDAVRELRAEAAPPEVEKDLPGPGASEWLHWVCSLQDDKDALVLMKLRKDFSALERFAGEMEESYWMPGQSPEPSTGPAEGPAATSRANVSTSRLATAVPGLDEVPSEMATRRKAVTAAVAGDPPVPKLQRSPE